MAVEARVDALKQMHADLEEAIETESNRPKPDEAVIADLKRQKLRIKDEINRLDHHA
jgi:hypothetical protein